MRTTIRILAVSIAGALALGGCGGGGGAGGSPDLIDEVEPNDSLATAQHLGTLGYDEDVRIAGQLNDDGRLQGAAIDAADWFAFTTADTEGTGIFIDLELSYFKGGLQLADNDFRLRAFFNGVELLGPLDDFIVQPEELDGDFATLRATIGALNGLGDGELVIGVEAITGGASYDLIVLTQRE